MGGIPRRQAEGDPEPEASDRGQVNGCAGAGRAGRGEKNILVMMWIDQGDVEPGHCAG